MTRYLILINIFFSPFVYSQFYKPMLNNHLEWQLTSCNSGCITDVYYIDGDTTFNNYNYKVLNGYHYISKTFWLREDEQERKIYMSFEYNFERKEVVLYDFSLDIGDTTALSNPISPFLMNPGNFIVDSVNYILLQDNQLYKVLYLSSLSLQSSEHPIWIEGIGSLSLINAPGGTPNVNGVGKLSCFFKNGSLIYSQLDSIPACNIVSNITEQSTTNHSSQKILKTIDVLGRETYIKEHNIFFYLYNDGSIEKKFLIK